MAANNCRYQGLGELGEGSNRHTTETSYLDSLIKGLDDFRKNLSAKEGLERARALADELGGKIENNPLGGIIVEIGDNKIHVWQLYEDIDKIYYEY